MVKERDEGIELNKLHPLDVTVSAVFGQATLNLKGVAGLEQGSAVRLERKADGPLLLRVNGMDFAVAEPVILGDRRLGVRILQFLR